MTTILIFDPAESAGGSINRAVDLAEKLNDLKFIFLTYKTLQSLNSSTTCSHITAKRMYSFYNGKMHWRHTEWINQHISLNFLAKLLIIFVRLLLQLDKASTILQAILLTYFNKIDIVQANCGFHPLPYHLANIKKARLIYYFRDLQNYTSIASEKINRASHYVFVGKNIMHEYVLQLDLPRNKCSMVHSPFDAQERLAKQINPDLTLIHELKQQGKKIIILPSRICEDKGQLVALEAINYLRENLSEFSLLIVGAVDPYPSSREYLKILLDYVDKHKLEEYVHFLGHRKDVLHLIKESDIAIHTPIYFEALAGALIESLQLGTPMVASNVGGTSEAIEHNHTGFLFQPGNSQELAQMLLRILENCADLETITRNGKKYALENWAPQNVQLSMRKIYLNSEINI